MQEAKEPTININISDNSNLAKEFKDEKDSWFMARSNMEKVKKW
jgi:hypothetical protein